MQQVKRGAKYEMYCASSLTQPSTSIRANDFTRSIRAYACACRTAEALTSYMAFFFDILSRSSFADRSIISKKFLRLSQRKRKEREKMLPFFAPTLCVARSMQNFYKEGIEVQKRLSSALRIFHTLEYD